MGDINKLYDNIKQLAGGKIEVGTVEQFTKALGNQDTAKKVYGNLSTVLTKDQIGSENDFLSFVQPSGVLRAPKQNFGIVPSIKMDQPEETTISKTETIQPDYIQKEAPLQIKDLKQNNSLNPNALGGLEKEIEGMYQNNIGTKIGDEHILPIGGGYKNTSGKANVDVQLNRPKTELPETSLYNNTPQLKVLKLKQPDEELKDELQKAHQIYETSNGKDLFSDEINDIIDKQSKGESYNIAGYKEDKAEAPKIGMFSTYVGSLIPKFFSGAYGTIGNTAGFARDFFPMLAQSIGFDVKTPSATDFQRDMGILSKRLNEISEINGDKSIKELHKEGDYLGIAAKVGKDIVGIAPAIIASGSMGGVGFFAANASEEKYDALKLDNTKDQNKSLNAVATGVISGVTMKLALEGMPLLLPYAGKLVTKYGTDEATKLISKSVYGGIATALKHSQSYVLPAAMAVQGMADTYANNVIDYVSGVSNNNNFTQGVQEAGWSGLATGIGFGAKGVLSHKSAVKEAKKNFDTSESGLISFLVEKGLTDGEVADAISLLRFSRNSQEKQGIITKLNNEITKPEYNSKDFSKTEEELIKTSDLLNSYVKSFDTYKSISYKFDKNNEVDRILAQQYLSDNTAPTAEQSNYNANQSQLEAQNPIQSEKIKAEQQLVDLSNKTTGTIQTVKLKDDSEIQIANGTPIFKEDGTFDAEKTGIITHNPKDENGNPVLNEDGTPKILVVDPNSIMSLVSETPVQEAQAEAGSQIDQAVAENEKNDFYPKTYTDYPTEDGQWRVSVNETTGKLEKQMIEVNENAKDEQGRPIVYEIDDPINITDEEYSQMSGKPIPTQGGETEPVLSTEPIVSTEPAPVQDNEVVQDGGSTTEPAPTYPADKNGNVDFKSMTDQQIFNHTKETKGEDAAHSLVGRQITRLQSQIQDNTRSTNKHNEETNKLLAKAKTMQDEVTIQAKQDAKEVSLKEEYTALNSKLGELQSLLPKVEAPAPVETPKVVTTRPEILQLQKEQAQANLDSSETLTPNLATSSEVLQPNVNTSNEVQETPVIEESSVAKPKETPFQKRAKALGEYIDMKDYILRIIAGGQKLKWKGGLESEFRGSNAERLQRRNYIDETNGLTPTELAHQIWNDYGENGNNGEIPGVYNMSDGEILDEVHEVLRTVKSNSDALLQAEERRTIGTYDPTPEEVQIIDAFDDEMFAAVLGITNFTPEQLTTLNDFISGWSEYIQHEQHSINTGTTPKSESNSTERNAISEEGSRTEEVSKEEQFNLTPAKDFGQFETNINWFLKNYGSREMAAIQVELYLNEKPEFGKEYIAKHGITTTDELKIYLGKLQAKLRAGKGNERKAVRSEIAKEKTERNVDEVIKLALEAEAEMQEAIRQSDLKGNSTEQKGTKENSSVLSPIKNGSIVTYEGKQYTINGITSDGKFVDLYEGDKMIHEDIPVESVSNSETLQQSDKTKLSETNNKKLDNQKIAKTENVESLPKSEPSEKVGQTITNMISRDVFRDNVSNSIQNDGQKVLDAHNEKDIATLKSIALKYAKDQGRLEGGGGAGPKKTTTPRRGASIVFQSAQIAISDIESKKQISNLDTLTGGEFSKTKSLQPEKIEDFGEKIEGARKDQIKKYFNKINLNGLTLSTVFPKPAFKYLLESGLNTKEASAIKVAYEFATTTKKRYKNDKEKFLGAVRFYAAYAKTILSENLNIEFANDGWVFTDHGKALIQLRAAAYEKVAKELGNEYLDLDLSKVKIHELTPEATRWMVKKPTEREKYEVQYYVSQSKRFETLEQALDEFLKQVKDNTKTDVVEYKRKLNIYRVSYGTEHFIAYQPSGKPLIKLKEGLKTVQEAVQYKKEFEADLHTMLERILAENKGEKRTVTRLKYTNETARQRIGKNWREGKDISTENFANTFGFRGVEYGNWVNQKERQVFLNNTYDSLMDLAQIIGVTPKAISLNGKLALSFGSRGSGGASAHYEPDRAIINLTKTKGLGSLAHEWFHAVDNYFADFKVSANGMKSAVNAQFKEGTRPEVQQAFKDLHNAFDGDYRQRSRMLDMGKSKIYFNLPYELAARAFENYMLTKTSDAGQINDFLANYVSPEDWKGQVNEYPYPLPEESKKIAEAFDNLFSTIEEGENGALFQASDKQLNQSTPEKVSQLSGLLLSKGIAKEVKMVTPEEMTAVLEGNEQLHAVYHGSPHSFDQFSLAHIGTGEGAQAYGHGLYFTDKKEIAQDYAKMADKHNANKLYDIAIANGFDNLRKYYSELEGIGYSVRMNDGDLKKAIENMYADYEKMTEPQKKYADGFIEAFKPFVEKVGLKNLQKEIAAQRNLYSVELHEGKQPGEYDYLRWEKPVSSEIKDKIFKQLKDENVRLHDMGSIKKFWDGESSDFESGDNMYGLLSNLLGSQKEASEFLLRAGIDGIQYPANHTTGKTNETDFNYVVFDPSAITIKEKVQFMRKPDGTIYGFVKDGIVYLNSEKPNLNTPIHEFGHLFTPIIKFEHPEFYQKGVELIKESPYYDQVKNDPNYSNLDEDGIIDEAMNQAIGDKGEKVVEKGLFERLKEWINGVWERIGAKFGIKNLTSEQIEKLTLNDWTDIVNSELLSGNKLTSNSEFVKNSKVKDVVYHGGANDISIFDKTKLGSYSGADSAKKGFFFTNDKTLAEDFAYDASFVISKYKQPDILKLIEKSDFDKIDKHAVGVIKDDYDFEAYDSVNDYLNQNGYINSETPSEKEYKEAINKFASENLYYGLNDSETVNEYKTIFKNLGIEVGKVSEVNINIENPLVVEKKIDFSDEDGLTHYIDEAIKNGNDGVIFNSVTEIIGGSKKIAKQYVVFEPTQIKLATRNDGSFSENNANFVEEKQIAYENEQEAIQKTIDFVSSERPTRIPLDNSRGYAEIHKRSVIEGFKESGYVDFVGRKINSIDDVVDMWNIHRSPYIEKSHIIFVKDGSIVGTTATTLNKVGITAFGKVEDIETLYNKFGADGMYLLHNHPSGNHKPSSGDIQTTQKIKDLLPEVNLIGHIVIDHDKYSYINPAKDGYKEFEQKNAPAKLFYERELVGNNPQKRLFEISKALLNGEGLKGAIIYLSPKLDINAYDVFPEGATQETIAELTKQGLKNNLGQVAIITHDGTFDKDWKVPANVVDVIDTKTGYSTYFENEKSDVITSNDILKLWEPTTNYPKPQPPVFTSDDTLVDQVRKTRNYEETLQRWQERQIGNLATQNGERLSPATISKLNKDINSVTSKLWEGWADAALPIKEFQKFLEKNGVPISDNDNYYMRLTTVPSRIEYRFNQFKEETMKPFIDTLKAIEKNGFTYDDITTYAKLKHGPEYTANILVREYTNKIEAERAKIEDITGSKDWTTKNQKLDQKIIDFKSTIFDYIEQQGIDYAGRDSIEKRIGETADNFITNFESENGSLVDEFWKQSKEVSHYALDEEVRGGMRTKESAEAIKGMFDYYVPLKGHREPTAETTWDYSMEHGDFFFSAVKKGKGRTSESDDPFSIMESTVRSAIGAAEQNLQLQSIRRLALKDTTGSMTVSKTWFVKVGEDENGNPEFKVADEVPFEDTDTNETYNEKVAKFEEKMKELKSKGEAYQGGSERLKLGLWIKPTNEREHEVVVKSNGESYTIRFHTSPRVPQAINGTNMRFYEGTFGAVLDGLGWATRHMAGFKTLWRPAFILVTNPLRDIHAGLNLAFIDEGAKFTANTVLNFRHAQAALLRRSLNKHDLSNKYDKMLNDFMVLGGKTGISKIMELKEIQKSIEKQMKSGKDPIGGVFDFYHAVSDITENQMRVAIYITAIEKGYSSLKATSMAKEATVNFDRKGNGRNGLRELKATYAFINVGFQAIDNIYSKSTKNTETKKRALLAIAANVLSGSLLVAAINTAMCALFGWDEDKWLEDFSKRSSFARNANFTIWTPEKLIDIPLGQEFRMYHGLGMDLMMMAHGKVSVMETSMNMIKGLSSQLPYNPIESSLQGSWASAMPDFASPLAELAANKSWLGYGIYKQNQDEAAPGYTKIKTNKKGEPYAPEVMIKLSKWLNEGTGGDAAEAGWLGFVNPDIADHLLGGYFAGIYEQPLTLLEATLSDKEGSLIKELTPRAILKNTADIQSRDTGLNEKYYKAKDEAEKVDKLIGRAEKAIGLLDKNSPDYEAQKEKYQYKIDKLKTDELYNIQGTQKTISALEKTLDEISPKEQVKTEKEISELKKNIVKINSGEKVDPKNYTEYISKYYGIVKKVEEYKTKMVLGEAEKDSELEKLHSKIFKSHGKLKSINAKINTLEKDTKKNPSNREKNEAQIITLIKKL